MTKYKENLKPRENLKPSEWAAANVYLANSPIGAKYQAGGHCDAILDDLANPDIYEISAVGHTGMGKSAVLESASCWIVAQASGPTLMIGQTNPSTNDWMETRMKPAFSKCEATKRLLPSGKTRNKNRKDAVIFPHMEYLTGGANLTNTQEKSMRYTLADEPWCYKHGLLGELLKRHHDRWNRKNLMVAQAGIEGTEWEVHTKNGLGYDRAFTCQECDTEQIYQWSAVKYDKSRDANDEWDWINIYKSVRYECINENCDCTFTDTAEGRHRLTAHAHYKSRENSHIPGRVTRYVPAMANPRIHLSSLVKEWLLAEDAWRNGDKEPRKQFIMKRLAQFWEEKPEVPTLDITSDPYQKSLYTNGEKMEDEHCRFMNIDVQKVGFWVAIRAWKIGDIKSRLLWEGSADTYQTLFSLQERFGLDHKDIFIDGRYNPDEIVRQIYMHCGEDMNNHWNILIGQDNDKGYSFEVGTKKRPRKVWKIFSKYQYGSTSRGQRYKTISFSNLKAKNALAAIMESEDGIFGVAVDASKNYVAQMQSEVKREFTPGRWKWEKIKSHYHNHLWDCETMGIVACSIMGVLKIETSGENENK